ncbi:malonic semialdehyde reductase [Halomonas campisalis]|uniref:Putative NADH dehydrogenase/NAD(P)H nitroreductase HOP52_13890 n=1 Tax=Billgrantia campisalis TaxID=74661 RepID=A0ABS9PAQ8_9GAMM|nr:malonic semialdehyde reductase [Halomonas campisalis]MCG6658847.1 malonic semialdehyde reductase [Halomonas campisalis]MDR5864504.1 malonic semialdehyde reductase [Halomonas campisalis]
MRPPLDDTALDIAFREARTHYGFRDVTIDEATLRRLYDLLKWGPTSMNSQPARYVFVTSLAGKSRLLPALSEGNRDKAREAAATVIVATDTRFYEHLPSQFPDSPNARARFADDPARAADTAWRNATLQGGYLIVAARMLGLDVGPMSGFDRFMVDEEFFPDGRYQSNFLVNLGEGDPASLRPRGPRLAFDEVAEVV